MELIMRLTLKRDLNSFQTHIPPLLMMALLLFSFESFSSPLSKIPRRKNINTVKNENKDSDIKIQKVTNKKSSVIRPNIETEIQEIKPVKSSTETSDIVKEFLKSTNLGISDNTTSFDILSATTLKGQILTSVKSSSLGSPIKVEIYPNSYFEKSGYLNCKGVPETASIRIFCTQLIYGSEEYDIEIELLNLDGTAGIRGEVYTGKEEGFFGSLLGAYLKGSLDVEQERVAIPTGEMIKNTSRNKVLGGTIGATDEGIDILQNEMKGKLPKIAIESGTQVYVYFLKRFKQ